ncbi:MAG: FAD-binding protein [Bdellovibrionales bacterium]|nr:FAD-binding protein [Bdellovibrionales bacterium]
MSERFEQIKVLLGGSLEEKLRLLSPSFHSYRLLKKSIDARGKQPHWVYSVEVFSENETPPDGHVHIPRYRVPENYALPIIVGSGPAGLFAALRLVERGIRCRLFEQGSRAEKRMQAIAKYWRYGVLDPLDNVCFGEGGAGLYSDGKLITRIKSPHIPYVLSRLVKFGAPEEILYLSNPHVGSDRIRKVIPIIREFLIENGCELHFNAKVKGLVYGEGCVRGVELVSGESFESDQVILATGHSATDMLLDLHRNGVCVEGKSFAVGLRIEHPQADINAMQFGRYAGNPDIGPATYRLADHDPSTGIGVYTFCMCPGGYVISSGTEDSGIVSNGMSNYARNSPFANAAVVVSIDYEKQFGTNVLAGLDFRAALEQAALAQVVSAGGTHQFPAQRLTDFLDAKSGPTLPSSSPSKVIAVRLDSLLPNWIYERLAAGLNQFDRNMKGFVSAKAQLHGVESRTSCPLRVVRDKLSLESTSHSGLYPTGEGAGYAGGITSAAVDGVRVAEAVASRLCDKALASTVSD